MVLSLEPHRAGIAKTLVGFKIQRNSLHFQTWIFLMISKWMIKRVLEDWRFLDPPFSGKYKIEHYESAEMPFWHTMCHCYVHRSEPTTAQGGDNCPLCLCRTQGMHLPWCWTGSYDHTHASGRTHSTRGSNFKETLLKIKQFFSFGLII